MRTSTLISDPMAAPARPPAPSACLSSSTALCQESSLAGTSLIQAKHIVETLSQILCSVPIEPLEMVLSWCRSMEQSQSYDLIVAAPQTLDEHTDDPDVRHVVETAKAVHDLCALGDRLRVTLGILKQTPPWVDGEDAPDPVVAGSSSSTGFEAQRVLTQMFLNDSKRRRWMMHTDKRIYATQIAGDDYVYCLGSIPEVMVAHVLKPRAQRKLLYQCFADASVRAGVVWRLTTDLRDTRLPGFEVLWDCLRVENEEDAHPLNLVLKYGGDFDVQWAQCGTDMGGTAGESAMLHELGANNGYDDDDEEYGGNGADAAADAEDDTYCMDRGGKHPLMSAGAATAAGVSPARTCVSHGEWRMGASSVISAHMRKQRTSRSVAASKASTAHTQDTAILTVAPHWEHHTPRVRIMTPFPRGYKLLGREEAPMDTRPHVRAMSQYLQQCGMHADETHVVMAAMGHVVLPSALRSDRWSVLVIACQKTCDVWARGPCVPPGSVDTHPVIDALRTFVGFCVCASLPTNDVQAAETGRVLLMHTDERDDLSEASLIEIHRALQCNMAVVLRCRKTPPRVALDPVLCLKSIVIAANAPVAPSASTLETFGLPACLAMYREWVRRRPEALSPIHGIADHVLPQLRCRFGREGTVNMLAEQLQAHTGMRLTGKVTDEVSFLKIRELCNRYKCSRGYGPVSEALTVTSEDVLKAAGLVQRAHSTQAHPLNHPPQIKYQQSGHLLFTHMRVVFEQ